MVDIVAVNLLEPEDEFLQGLGRDRLAHQVARLEGLSLSFSKTHAIVAGPRPLMDRWVAAQTGDMDAGLRDAYQRALKHVDAVRPQDFLRRIFEGAGAPWTEKVRLSGNSVTVTPCRWQKPKPLAPPPQVLDIFPTLREMELKGQEIA